MLSCNYYNLSALIPIRGKDVSFVFATRMRGKIQSCGHRRTVNSAFILYREQPCCRMNIREIENNEQLQNEDGTFNLPPPPAEPIYDLTTPDKTLLVKAAGPIERGENP